MKVVHSLGKFKIEKNIKDEVSFILANKIGSYCYFASKLSSRYQGVFFNDNFRMYKVIEDIRLTNAPPIKELKNNFFNVERKRQSVIESFFMPHGFNSAVYELSKEGEIELVLDIRESYSNPDFGRFYEIFEENEKIIIKYKQENEFECYLAISGYLGYEKTQKWFEQHYELDKQRNSLPYDKYVFSALKIKLSQLILSFSFNKEKAIKENDFILSKLYKLKHKQKTAIMNIVNKNKRILGKIKDREAKLAYICALNSLNNLVVNINGNVGVYAGLPWLFQFWARDEAISLESIKYFEKKEIIRKILLRLIDNTKENRILNKYPGGDIYTIDAVGWILKRVHDLNKSLLKNNNIKSILGNLDSSIAVNDKNETWMDSLDRANARIEIQALKLFMLKLGNKNKFEMELKNKVREKFWNGKFLKDCIDDETIRPNIFIAAYIYPELLSNEEWVVCFEYALKKLWLGWGGLSTIDKSNTLFSSRHTGEIIVSYHNGDSWFWLNNLAALTLYKTGKKKFAGYIKKILNASKSEILWKGVISHHAELSPASLFGSEGCLMQAWSSAMFIELINRMNS